VVEKPEGKNPVGKTWSRWKDNIIMNLREIQWEVVDGIHLAQNRGQWRDLGNTVKKFRVP
jgi:hypothetical protein